MVSRFLKAIFFVWSAWWGWLEQQKETEKSKSDKKAYNKLSAEAQMIVDEINTVKQVRALERKMENAESRLGQQKSEKAYEKACHKHDILQEAFFYVGEKHYEWQFMPEISIYTPKKNLEHAYKVYSVDDYERLKAELKTNERDWHGLSVNDEKEPPEPHLKAFIKFREIVESDEPKEEQIKKINRLVSRNRAHFEYDFYSDDRLTPGEMWFADKLCKAGLPLCYDLYSDGYITPEKCLEINHEEFVSRKGVGAKKLEQLKKFQEDVRQGKVNID